nr:PHB depolymerase family esterase [Burkholderiales bacterium]
MRRFFKRSLLRPLAAITERWRQPPQRSTKRRLGRWEEGSYSNPKGALFYAPGLPPKRSYRLYLPSRYDGVAKLPLLVMLHGCRQDATMFAAGTRMNQLADRENFLLLYPEQRRGANFHHCWNWFDPSTITGNGEAALVAGMVREISKTHAVDRQRVYVAGLSAGGALANILASLYGELFAACAVHSGLPYRAADSLAEARRAMQNGSQLPPEDAARQAMHFAKETCIRMPALIIHGSDDEAVNPINADQLIGQFLHMAESVNPNAANDSADIRRSITTGNMSDS